MTAKEFARLLTLSRFPLGVIAAALLYYGKYTAGLAVYILALGTDAADGYLARKANCESNWGREWDRRADMFMNLVVTVGFIAGAYFVKKSTWWALGPLMTAGGLMLVTLPFFGRHSAASKLRSGVIRFIMLGFIFARMKWNFDAVCLLVILASFGLPAIAHEINVTKEEVRTGKRRWFKSPIRGNER